MKTSIILLLASLICFRCGAADAPRYKACVTCFNGRLDSGSSCSVNWFQTDSDINVSGKMTCGVAGKVSEIEWSFVQRHGDKDVYRFKRRFPSDMADSTTTITNIEFSNQRVIVFQDTNQVVVIQPQRKKP